MTETGFFAFDEITGGLSAGKDYLLYGAIGTGKSSFALGFLNHGLAAGEPAALVTRRAPRAVLEQARSLGWNLEQYVRSGQLTVLEYPEDLHEHTSVLRDPTAIYQGFRDALSGSMRRIVFDPITPLLVLPGAAYQSHRVKGLMQALGELDATLLYLVDTPEGEAHLPGCKDQVFGMLRFDFHGGLRRLSIERIPGVTARQNHILFDVRPDGGLVQQDIELPSFATTSSSPAAPRYEAPLPEVAPGLPNIPWTSRRQASVRTQSGRRNAAGRWTALVVSSSADERAAWRAALEPQATVVEAKGPAECVGMATAENPDLILISQKTRGITSLELVRKLRSIELSAPLVLIGPELRRLNDRVRALESGADLTLQTPLDARLLRLHSRMLLGRSSSPADQVQRATEGFAVATAPERRRLICTASLEQFQGRMQAETTYALSANLPFAVVSFECAEPEEADELASVCAFLSRHDDLTYSGDRGAAVLLAEAEDAEPFLARFQARWPAAGPSVNLHYFEGIPEFAAETAALLRVQIGDRGEVRRSNAAAAPLTGAVDAAIHRIHLHSTDAALEPERAKAAGAGANGAATILPIHADNNESLSSGVVR